MVIIYAVVANKPSQTVWGDPKVETTGEIVLFRGGDPGGELGAVSGC